MKQHQDGGNYTYQTPAPVQPSDQRPIPPGAPVLPMAQQGAPVLPPAHAGQAPEPLRSFDLRTAPDRLQAYCDALSGRVEQLERALIDAGHRISGLENVADGGAAEAQHVSAETLTHRLLNPGEGPDEEEVADD